MDTPPVLSCLLFHPQPSLSVKFFTFSKLLLTVSSCPEVFIVWRSTQALPASSQMFHCGRSICHCLRCRPAVTMEMVLGWIVGGVRALEAPKIQQQRFVVLNTLVCQVSCNALENVKGRCHKWATWLECTGRAGYGIHLSRIGFPFWLLLPQFSPSDFFFFMFKLFVKFQMHIVASDHMSSEKRKKEKKNVAERAPGLFQTEIEPEWGKASSQNQIKPI